MEKAEKAIEKAEKAMENGDFKAAARLFEIAGDAYSELAMKDLAQELKATAKRILKDMKELQREYQERLNNELKYMNNDKFRRDKKDPWADVENAMDLFF